MSQQSDLDAVISQVQGDQTVITQLATQFGTDASNLANAASAIEAKLAGSSIDLTTEIATLNTVQTNLAAAASSFQSSAGSIEATTQSLQQKSQ